MPIEARAVRIRGAGGPEVLSLATLNVRDPGPDEVRVAISAAGLNRADCLQRRGVYPAPKGVVADVPGLEFAGTVECVGAEVSDLRVGERVMGICAGGAMATHIVVHAGELLRVPGPLSLIEAAAVPEAFMTAYDALVLQGELGLGQTALIHAAASGVGTAAIQLVRALGAIAIGTSRSEDKLARVMPLGLTHGICTADGHFADRVRELTDGEHAHVVLDTVGAKYITENLKAVAPGGRIIVIGLLGGAKGELPLGLLVAKRASLRGSVLRSRTLGEKLALAAAFRTATLGLFEQGLLRPVVEDVLPMADVQKAHTRMEADDVIGKLVLSW
jgi:putative PIG3 family NAD(P)H quinone oxidoreductase